MSLTQARVLAGSITLVGVIGFVGLLVAGHYVPEADRFLQIAAFVWFFAFGAVRITLQHSLARRVLASGKKRGNGSTKPQPW
jgi:hypothetical protein